MVNAFDGARASKRVARDCDEENAFNDPETSEITMCTALLAAFMADAKTPVE